MPIWISKYSILFNQPTIKYKTYITSWKSKIECDTEHYNVTPLSDSYLVVIRAQFPQVVKEKVKVTQQ